MREASSRLKLRRHRCRPELLQERSDIGAGLRTVYEPRSGVHATVHTDGSQLGNTLH